MKRFLLLTGLCLLTAYAGSGQSVLFEDDFESGTVTAWTDDNEHWAASPADPISGIYSLKHALSDVADISVIYTDITGVDVSDGPIEWKFNLKNGSWDPSSSNKFIFLLMGDESNPLSSTQNGYAVGVNYFETNDLLTLWEVTDGSATALVTSSLDWGSSDLIGIRIERDESGGWILEYDSDGGFDTLAEAGTATDTNHSTYDYSSLYFRFTSSRAGELWLDDLTIRQTVLSETATKLAITSINDGIPPSANTAFDVVVEAQDDDDLPAFVTGDIDITLSPATGSGALGGTLTGTIPDGTTSATISGVTYSPAESGVSITASDDAENLTDGTSASFNVLEAADRLEILGFPESGIVDKTIGSFTVEARRSDNSVDPNYGSGITLSIASGTGNLAGTATKTAVSGAAAFDDITFDAEDDFTIEATDGTLTSDESSQISIIDPDFFEDFESGTQTSYTTGTVTLKEGDWILDDALLGTLENDKKNGSQAARIRASGSIEMDFEKTGGIGAVSFYHARYGSDSGGELELFHTVGKDSAGNDIWVSAGTVAPGSTLEKAEFILNAIGPSRIRIFKSGGNRINVDDIIMSDAGTGTRAQEISGSAGWRLLSLPVTGGTVSDITDDTQVQGIAGGDDPAADSNFKIYDDSGTFEDPANINTAWGDGYGFALYFFDNTISGSSELPITLDATGSEPSSDVTVNLNTSTLEGGSYFTLVGNPFASEFNTITLGADILDNIHFWNHDLSSYVVRERFTPYIIPAWQGFWVEASEEDPVSTITFPTGGKTTSPTTVYAFLKQSDKRGDISFILSSEATYDESIRLSFRDYATFGFDRADASKLIPLVPEYATMAFLTDGRMKSVESLPYDLLEMIELKLELQIVGVQGRFNFAWSGLETIPAEWSLTLNDFETGESVDMRTSDSYTFESAPTEKEKENPLTLQTGPAAKVQKAETGGTARFGITILPDGNNPTGLNEIPEEFALDQNYPNPFNPTTTIRYEVAKRSEVILEIFNGAGRKVTTLENGIRAPGIYQASWDARNMSSGIYYYRLTAGNKTFTRKMILIK